MADTIYMNRELSWLKFNERVLGTDGKSLMNVSVHPSSEQPWMNFSCLVGISGGSVAGKDIRENRLI